MSEEKRIKPDVFMVTLLDDIRHEIVKTRKLTESMIEKGIMEPLQPKTITTQKLLVTPPDPTKPWFGVKITNDGSHSVWLVLNPRKTDSLPQEIKAEETWGVQFKTAVIKDLLLYTDDGSATVRIRGER